MGRANTGRRLIGLAVLATLSVFEGPAAAEEPVTVPVVLDNRANVSHDDLESAKQRVCNLFRSVGVTIQWMSPHEADVASAGAFRPRVLLVARREADHVAAGQSEQDVLGVSFAPARLAYVFSSRILISSLSRGTRFPPALGQVMAHELGHLLLPGQPHTAAGLMCPSAWCLDQAGGLNEEQGASIRGLLTAARNWSDMELARHLWARPGPRD